MSTPKETALQGVESALSDAVSRVSATYEACLVDAAGDAGKEADRKAIRDRSLGLAKRVHADMIDAVNQQWPHGS